MNVEQCALKLYSHFTRRVHTLLYNPRQSSDKNSVISWTFQQKIRL